MKDFKSLLNALNLQDEQPAMGQVEIPFAPNNELPANYNQLAQQEELPAAPIPAPVVPKAAPVESSVPAQLLKNFQGVPEDTRSPASTDVSSMSQTKNKVSGMIPDSDKAEGSETAEGRLERLMRELNEQRNKDAEDASSRQFKANMIKAITDNLGGVVAGSQAMNTKAAVNPVKTQGYDVGDLVGQVDKKFAGDREALMDQYKQLLNARDRSEQRKFQQEQLNLTREGLKIKQQLANQKAAKDGAKLTLTPGEEAADKNFAKDYNNLTSKGLNNASTAVDRLEKLADEIEKEGDGIFAAGGGRTSVLPDVIRSDKSIRWRDAAANEANTTLKELFPGSLSDDERRAAAREYYNDKLSNSENAKIIRSKANQLRQSFEDQRTKADYFSKSGTLKGLGPNSARNPAENTISNVDAKIDAFMKKNADKVKSRDEAIAILKKAGKI